MPRKEIVLVEDNPADVAVALRALRRHRLEDHVVVLRDGEQALEYLLGDGSPGANGGPCGELPKVVFLDLKMPKVDGWEVLRELRADDRTRDLPVVVISASDRETDVRESYRLGANSFVQKRFDGASPGEFLAEAARYWLELNRTTR